MLVRWRHHRQPDGVQRSSGELQDLLVWMCEALAKDDLTLN